MTVVQFKPREERGAPPPPRNARRSLGEFTVAMGVVGLALFMLPMLWSGFSTQLLAVVHLLIAVVYFQQGPRLAAGAWIALSLVVLVLTSAPSPVTYLLARGAHALDATLAGAPQSQRL